MAPQPTPIYHITHLNNLPDIIAQGGLACCADLRGQGATYHDIANTEIQDRRAGCPVPVPPYGHVHDYVPFYFAPRSPMLYVINRGGPRYPEGQRRILHLVSTAQAVYAVNGHCVFTDGHAIMALSNFYTDLDSLDQIAWEVMASRYWNDTADFPGRKRQRQAEFLVYRQFAWELVTEIGVHDRSTAAEVVKTLGPADHRPPVRVQPDWYY